jgi:hypothetical protein
MNVKDASSASDGCRRAHFTPRPHAESGRATIGSPRRNRWRSSPSASAVRYRFAGFLRQALQADRFEVAGDRGLELPGRDRVVVEHLEDGVERGLAEERRAAGEEFVQDRPERVDVDRRADLARLARRLLGGDVAGRPHYRAGLRAAVGVLGVVEPLGQSEVGDLRDRFDHLNRGRLAPAVPVADDREPQVGRRGRAVARAPTRGSGRAHPRGRRPVRPGGERFPA